MPEKRTIARAKRARREGKAASTQAGEFVREEIEKIRRGRHGARSAKQAIAIGLSEARKAGVDLPPPEEGKSKAATRKSARYAREVGQKKRKPTPRPRAVRAATEALQKEPQDTVSREALSDHAKEAAARRKPAERSAAARKAARTKARKRSAASSGKKTPRSGKATPS